MKFTDEQKAALRCFKVTALDALSHVGQANYAERLEEAEESIHRAFDDLTRPPVEFAEGEVAVCYKNGEFDEYAQIADPVQFARQNPEASKLSTVESGAGELVTLAEYAITALLKSQNAHAASVAGHMLTKWKSDRGEE